MAVPFEINLPDHSILTEDEYAEMYDVVTNDEVMNALKTLYKNQPDGIDKDKGENAAFDQLLDVGLASRHLYQKTFSIRITSLGKTIVENGPEDGVKALVEAEHSFEDTYSSD